MGVVRFEDARGFRDAIQPLIGPTEARHNLVHGILGTLVDDPPVIDEHRLWLVDRDTAVVSAAVRTPPRNLILCDGADPEAMAELAAGIASEPERLPGVLGNRPSVDWFVDAWSEVTGDDATPIREQGLFALEAVVPQPWPPGAPRLATTGDAELLVEWLEEFVIEVMPELPPDRERFATDATRLIEQRRGAGAWLWDRDGVVVSLSVHGNPTPHGMRIGPVYTPPAHRGQGHATALVAHQSEQLLASGHRDCFLYTDLANPTSNAIYERIGYRQIATAVDYELDPPDSASSGRSRK